MFVPIDIFIYRFKYSEKNGDGEGGEGEGSAGEVKAAENAVDK